jgi:hypothetical protein
MDGLDAVLLTERQVYVCVESTLTLSDYTHSYRRGIYRMALFCQSVDRRVPALAGPLCQPSLYITSMVTKHPVVGSR